LITYLDDNQGIQATFVLGKEMKAFVLGRLLDFENFNAR
jgi:hypothetical protein